MRVKFKYNGITYYPKDPDKKLKQLGITWDDVEIIEEEDNWYKTPNNVVGVLANPITGAPANNGEKSKIFYYIKGTQPSSNNNDLEEAIATMKQQ